MDRLQLVVLFGITLAPLICVAQSAAPASPAHGTSSATHPLPIIQRGIKHKEAEVKRLQGEVIRQESDSDRASERLRLQDRQIAELRKKLAQLQAKSAAGQP